MRYGDHLPAGRLDQKITLKAQAYNAAGDEKTGLTMVAEGVPAMQMDFKGREMVDADRIVAEADAVFTIRYRPGLDTIEKLVHRGQEYDILRVSNVNGSNIKIELTCKKIV